MLAVLGCVYYTMLNGYTPFNVDPQTGEGWENISQANYEEFDVEISEDGTRIFTDLIQLDPESRIYHQ